MLKKITLLVLFILPVVSAQTKNNLQIFYQLIDSTVSEISLNLKSDTVVTELVLPESFLVFKPVITENLIKKKFTVKDKVQPVNNSSELIFTAENAKVEYGEIFRKSFLGSYYVERSLTIKGNYLIKNNNINNTFFSDNFEKSYTDTIELEMVEEVENPLYKFTRGEMPAEPFFAGLLEPVVAIGAAAIAVYLFFSVRSK